MFPVEIEEIKNATWELDCPKMTLQKNSKVEKDLHEGGGYIKRDPDGTLRFKLYSTERPLDLKKIFRSLGTSGKLIDDGEFYELSATDTKGRVWKSDRILIQQDGSVDKKGSVVYGKIYKLINVHENLNSSTNKYNHVKIYFFQNFKVPGNAVTETTVVIGGQKRRTNSDRNIAQFSSCGCDFEIRNEDEGVTLEARGNDVLPINLELRVTEALQFVMGTPLEWTIMQKSENNIDTILIKHVSSNHKKPKIGPPINTKDPRNTSFVWQLFDNYLNYIIHYKEEYKYHLISVYNLQVLKGSEGSIEPMMLTLGIAVEGILNEAFPELKKLPENKIEELERSKKIIKDSSLEKDFKNRLIGAMERWDTRSATSMLYYLVETEVVKNEEVNAWKKIRNPTAHAVLPDSNDLQELVDFCHTVSVLFYKLIFHAIGYNGKYTNYGLHGWPLEVK